LIVAAVSLSGCGSNPSKNENGYAALTVKDSKVKFYPHTQYDYASSYVKKNLKIDFDIPGFFVVLKDGTYEYLYSSLSHKDVYEYYKSNRLTGHKATTFYVDVSEQGKDIRVFAGSSSGMLEKRFEHRDGSTGFYCSSRGHLSTCYSDITSMAGLFGPLTKGNPEKIDAGKMKSVFEESSVINMVKSHVNWWDNLPIIDKALIQGFIETNKYSEITNTNLRKKGLEYK